MHNHVKNRKYGNLVSISHIHEVKHCVSFFTCGHFGTFCTCAVMWDFEFVTEIYIFVTLNVSSIRNIVPWGPFGGHFGNHLVFSTPYCFF